MVLKIWMGIIQMKLKNNSKKGLGKRIFVRSSNIKDVSLPPADNNHALKMLYLVYCEKFSDPEKEAFEEFLKNSSHISQRRLLNFLSDNPEIRRRIWEKT